MAHRKYRLCGSVKPEPPQSKFQNGSGMAALVARLSPSEIGIPLQVINRCVCLLLHDEEMETWGI